MKPTILFLFNSSHYAAEPWLYGGDFNCVSVDYDATDHSGSHRPADRASGHSFLNYDLSQPDAVEYVQWWLERAGFAPPALVISFAPCTDLAVSGARHFAAKRERDPEFQDKAVRLAQLASEFGCPYVVENPVSVLSTMWRKPDMICHPYYFAGYIDPWLSKHPEFPGIIPDRDLYRKKTCLWYGNGFVRPYLWPIEPTENDNPGWAKLGGKSARTKYIRSLTPRGMAHAIYEANAPMVLKVAGPIGIQ